MDRPMKDTVKRLQKALNEANDMIEYHQKRIKSYQDEVADLQITINQLESIE